MRQAVLIYLQRPIGDCLAVSGENKYFESEILSEVSKKLNCFTKSQILSDIRKSCLRAQYTHA